ncbi:MAG TPA: DUF1353 domain-containing protein [Thermoanaerobaculia bacterium]|jgi:hypothetical protein|nr:DUF1353 domain-containing protein [Thermoanaerobaculia bacterium]
MTFMVRPANRGVGRFEGTPKVEYLNGATRVRLLEEFAYHDCTGRRWTAPKGLVSDGASIPRELWTIVGSPMMGPHFFAGLLHDARYRLADCTKEEADLLLWDACLCGGTSEADALAIAEGVAVGGAGAWAENAAKRAACGADLAKLLEWA